MVFTLGPMGSNTRHLRVPFGPTCSNSPSSRVMYRGPSTGATLVMRCRIRSSVVDAEISETRIFRATYPPFLE